MREGYVLAIDAKIVVVTGKKFLKCHDEHCPWNIGWLGNLDWTEEAGQGIRVCDLGARGIIVNHITPPDDCRQANDVFNIAYKEIAF